MFLTNLACTVRSIRERYCTGQFPLHGLTYSEMRPMHFAITGHSIADVSASECGLCLSELFVYGSHGSRGSLSLGSFLLEYVTCTEVGIGQLVWLNCSLAEGCSHSFCVCARLRAVFLWLDRTPTMYLCRTAWQKVGPLARKSATHLSRNGKYLFYFIFLLQQNRLTPLPISFVEDIKLFWAFIFQ